MAEEAPGFLGGLCRVAGHPEILEDGALFLVADRASRAAVVPVGAGMVWPRRRPDRDALFHGGLLSRAGTGLRYTARKDNALLPRKGPMHMSHGQADGEDSCRHSGDSPEIRDSCVSFQLFGSVGSADRLLKLNPPARRKPRPRSVIGTKETAWETRAKAAAVFRGTA